MDHRIYAEFLSILKEELVCAMGCTEPAAIAYCAAMAGDALGMLPDRVQVRASANIIKNAKSVVVPGTGGLRGIAAAAAAGLISGVKDQGLQVLAGMTKEQAKQTADYLQRVEIDVVLSEREYLLDIQVSVFSGTHHAMAEIAGSHTNLIHLETGNGILVHQDYREDHPRNTNRDLLSVGRIVEFADQVKIEEVREILQRQIECNTAIAEAGLSGNYGANIGSILMKAYGTSVHNRAKACAAAGSDARMNGCELPVVINSGSGNQGITASLPVIVYAEDLHVSQEVLYRALVVSNLITIHLKTGIGPLSAYCGATSAGCGAAAGITYLYGGRESEIAHTIVNSIAIDSGMICDGAKASCAAKIASAVEAGLLGMQMQKHNSEFFGGDGIVVKGVENTIRNIGDLARFGMRETDRTILRLMTEDTEMHPRRTAD